MKVELLPSSVPPTEAQFLVSFLVNDTVAIDAGPLGLLSDLRKQGRVRHVFLTHEHIDHVATLPIFLENVYEPGPDCVELLGRADVLDFIHDDIFNGRVWPDFFALSTPADRFITATTLAPLVTVERAGCRITPVPVHHGTDTLAMVVDDGDSCVAFAADTGPTDLLWEELARRPTLRAVFLECSFPEALAGLAARSDHLSPASFAAQAARLPAGVRTLVIHRKAAHAETIAAELAARDLPGVELAVPGRRYDF